jgi:predicted nucleotidyltransferase
MPTANRDLEQARQIVLNELRGRPAKVYLFGSWARNEARRYSDIDIGILPTEPLPPELLLELADKLDQSEVLYPVDLVDLSTAPASLRDRVLAEGILWTG